MRSLVIVSTILSLSLSSWGGIVGYAPLPILERQADRIIVAEIETATASPSRSTVVVRIVRTLKGLERSAGSLETLAVDSDLLDVASVKTYGPLLWFISSTNMVLSRIANVPRIDAVSFPAVNGARYAEIARGTSARGLGLELAAVAGEGSIDGQSMRQVSHYLQSRPGGERAQLETVAAAKDDAVRVAGLLRRGTLAGVQALLQQSSIHGNASVRDALCAYRSPNPAGISALARLLDSTTESGLAVCALVALKEIHTAHTVPVLAKALDRTDVAQRYLAVSGLYFAANAGAVPFEQPLVEDDVVVQRPAPAATSVTGELPSFDAYQAAESRFVAFWKTWAATN